MYVKQNIRSKYILVVLFIFSSLFSFSQNVEFNKDNFKDNKDGLKEAKNNLDKGDRLYEKGDIYYKQAIDPYLLAYKFNPNNALLNYKLGKSYLYSNNKIKSIPYLEKALELNPKVDLKIHYDLGKAYHLDMQWDKAVAEFKQYEKEMTYVKDYKEVVGPVEKHIQECFFGKELVKSPVNVFIDNVGEAINSTFPDYGPVITADESVMMFTSRRPTTTGGSVDENLNEFKEDIYISTKVNGKWGTAVNLGSPINTKDHDAILGLSPDGQTMYLYQGDGNIYESTLKGSAWSKPEKMSKNINSDYHESAASLSPDGKTLYFVSDRPDGVGDRDIWMSTKDEKGKWGKATNLGSTINTPYSEESVFMHPDGKTLYFSSQGHKTMGGFDIFKSVFENGKWSEPENLGYPVNTADDDILFTMSASGKHGYYSSFNPNGFGAKDIYMITFFGTEKPMVLDNEDNLLASVFAPVKENVVAPSIIPKDGQLTILKGVITDEKTKKPLEATVEIVDNEKNEVIASFSSNSSSGNYLVSLPAGKNYGIAVKKDGYLFHSENFDVSAKSAFKEIKKDIALSSITVGNKIVLNNIFFDSDKATLRSQSTVELRRVIQLLQDEKTLKIEISGYTDSKGKDDYNKTLSENRAKEVVGYIVKAGIKQDRLTYVGYGKEQPIANNDTEEGRQMNRRTEFKIISK